MSETLKPCPFCGGETFTPRGGDPFGGNQIRCASCGAEGPGATISGREAAWNRRAPQTVVVPRMPVSEVVTPEVRAGLGDRNCTELIRSIRTFLVEDLLAQGLDARLEEEKPPEEETR